jgi:hypothetical protein
MITMTDIDKTKANSAYSLAHQMPHDDRQKQWQEQFATYGFDNTELWNLDMTIARFIRPRLKRYLEVTPLDFSEAERQDLQMIVNAFEVIEKDVILTPEQSDIAQKGIQLFPQYFFRLWY